MNDSKLFNSRILRNKTTVKYLLLFGFKMDINQYRKQAGEKMPDI